MDGALNMTLLRKTKGDPVLFGFAIFGAGGSVNASPTASLTAPVNNSTYEAPAAVSLAAAAADSDGTIAKVEFFNGGAKIGEDTTSPYTYTWTDVPQGSYTLTARATDNGGATGTSAPVNITVNPEPGGSDFVKGINLAGSAVVIEGNPWLSYQQALTQGLEVQNASSWAGSYPFQLKPATDADTTAMLSSLLYRYQPANGQGFNLSQTLPNGNYMVYVWSVENHVNFFRDFSVALEGQTVASALGSLQVGEWKKYGPFPATVTDGALNLDILRTSKGDPLITGVAIFRNGPPGNQIPQVQFTAPADGAVFPLGATIAMQASASDPDGTVARVEFYDGTTKLGEDATAPYTYNWVNPPAGTHELTARAVDNLGAWRTHSITVRSRGTAVMPLGDSITWGTYLNGFDGDGGYRYGLWNRLQTGGYSVDFVGSLAFAPLGGDPDHEGHPGWRIDQLAPSADGWVTAHAAEVVLLHAGTNDVLQGATGPVMEARMADLLDRVLAARPGVHLLVATIIDVRNPNSFNATSAQIAALNDRIPALVQARAAQGHNIRLVNMHDLAGLVATDYSADGVHPNASGYDKMAAVWYSALQQILTPGSNLQQMQLRPRFPRFRPSPLRLGARRGLR
jgi:lysophospholipase L1-like esterase